MNLRGMFMDSVDKANQPEFTWTDNTKNIVVTRDGKAIANEDGFIVYSPNYPILLSPIGYIGLYNDDLVIFSVEEDTSEIGIIRKGGHYETVLRDSLLGFHKDRKVFGTKQQNIFGEVEIIFTDGVIPLSILNLDKLPFELDEEKGLVDKSLINNLYIFPNMHIPSINIEGVDASGGSIPTGVVHFTGQYEDFNGALTNVFPVGNPVLIIPRTEGEYKRIGGGKPNEMTGNAVRLHITGLDRRFKKLHMIAVQKSGGQYYAARFGAVNISADETRYVYTGTEAATQEISLGEVVVKRPSYESAAGVLSHDDILYPYGMRVKPKLNIQKYVNAWRVRHVTETVNVAGMANSYKDGKTYATKRTFLHNEVYALYAVPVLLDGTYGDAFHLPGREVRQVEGFGFQEDVLISTLTGAHPHLVEDAHLSPNARYYQVRNTAHIDGAMGYWVNQSEQYPDTEDWDIHTAAGVQGTLRGQSVRHHKTPTLDTNRYLTGDLRQAYTVGLMIEDIWLPDEIWAQIQGIEIFYAKRTGGNSTLTGRGLLMFAANDKKNGDPDMGIASNGINIDFEARERTERVNLRNDAVRIQAYDMLVDKTSILPTHMYVNTLFKTKIWVDKVEEGASSQLRLNLADPLRSQVSAVSQEQRIRVLHSQQYFPQNTIIDTGLSNRWAEETFFAKLRTPGFMGITPYHFIDLSAENREEDYNNQGKRHQTFLVDLVVWRENAYFNFQQQELVSTGYRIGKGVTRTETVYGGDGYIGTHGWIATAGTPNTWRDPNEHDASRIRISYIVETANPAELQYDEFYPRNEVDIEQHMSNATEFPIRANKDYTSLNSLNPVSGFDPELREATYLPNRILRSKKSQREERVSSWRIFLPNDYYEVARERGRIIHMEAMNGELLIQQEYGLFLTRGSDTFTTDMATVEVGSGDVFRMPPREIVDSKDGYIGCQSKSVCIKGKNFYFTVDELQGKVFILDNNLKEISNEGMYRWFRDRLIVENLMIVGDTAHAAFDEVNNRILLSKRAAVPKRYRGRIEDVDLDTLEIGDSVFKDGRFVKVTDIDCPPLCDAHIEVLSITSMVCDAHIELLSINNV